MKKLDSIKHIGPSNGPMSLLDVPRQPRSAWFMSVVLGTALLAFVGLCALGTWQVQRRTWKLDLIERVNQRVHAIATPAPPPASWNEVSAHDDEYRHVFVTGRLLNSKPSYVQASTIYGSGYWLIVPLQAVDGSITLINRGFVSTDERPQEADARAPSTIVGLLRISEPRGTHLRNNEPGADRWFSRDVGAIARKRSLSNVAPYFIDAEASAQAPGTEPIGGLTVISFYNHHLVYAITWYTLALMVAVAAIYLIKEERTLRRG